MYKIKPHKQVIKFINSRDKKVGGLSIINGIFGVNHINSVIIPIVAYIVIC